MIIKIFRIIFTYSIVLGLYSSADANNELLDSFRKEFREKMSVLEDISFNFVQRTYIDGSTQTLRAEVSFMNPDLMRVIYTEPRRQELYHYGGNLYTYIPEINQATRQRHENLSDFLGVSASLIVTGGDLERLEDEYRLSVAQEDSSGVLLTAVPLRDTGYEKLQVKFDRESLLPVKTVVTAPHIRSVTEFSGFRINSRIGEDTFIFTPRGRVNIIDIH